MITEIKVAIITAVAIILGAVIGFIPSYFTTKTALKIETTKMKLELLRNKQEILYNLSETMFQMVPAGTDPLAATFDNFMKQASEFEMCAYLFPVDLANRVSSTKSKLGKLITGGKIQNLDKIPMPQDLHEEITAVQTDIKTATTNALRETQQDIGRLIK